MKNEQYKNLRDILNSDQRHNFFTTLYKENIPGFVNALEWQVYEIVKKISIKHSAKLREKVDPKQFIKIIQNESTEELIDLLIWIYKEGHLKVPVEFLPLFLENNK